MRMLLALMLITHACAQCSTIDGGVLPNGFCGQLAPANLVRSGRGMVVVDDGVLVLDRGQNPQQVRLLVDNNTDGMPDAAFVIVSQSGLNHGLLVRNGFIYASSDTTVWRWPFAAGQRNQSTGRETVIMNMNENGQGGAPQGHTTRTMAFDSQGRLYVQVGSGSNLDIDSSRARIRRFTIPTPIPAGGIDFLTGEVYADGLRNEVGIGFDKFGVLWGVENGADDLNRGDLGGDIHHQNPGEELNRFPECCAGRHFGYPYCFTEYDIPTYGQGRGSVWSWPGYANDTWCRSSTVGPPVSMQSHSAPLSIAFFDASKTLAPTCSGGFPAWMDGDAFIAFHGSWDRQPPTGYKVVRVPMTLNGYPRTPVPFNFFCHGSDSAAFPSGLRPVQVAFDNCNRMLLTSDGTGTSLTGGGLVLFTYNCLPCTAGSNGSECCTFTHNNVNNNLAGSCPGCGSAYPAIPVSQPGVWQTSVQCPEVPGSPTSAAPTSQPSTARPTECCQTASPTLAPTNGGGSVLPSVVVVGVSSLVVAGVW